MTDPSEMQICFISSVDEAEELRGVVELLAGLRAPIGVDTETTGLDPLENRVRLISVGAGELALVVDLNAFREGDRRQVDWGQDGLRELKALLEGCCPKVLQNAAFDLNFLRGEGVVLGGQIFDTMFAAKVVNNGQGSRNDLGSIVSRELKWELPKELQKADWGGEITEDMVRYSARDAWCLPLLVEPLLTKLKSSRIGEVTLYDVFKLESMCLRPIAAMQWYGFTFDQEAALELKAELVTKAESLMLELLDTLQERLKAKYPTEPGRWLPLDADGSYNTRTKDEGSIRKGTKRYKGFNPRSVQQMTEKFSEVGIILPPNEKGKPSMDQNLLAFLRNDSPLIDQYMTWKEAATRVSCVETLLGSVGSDGRIHANYRQMGTDTGRLSCSGPNLQQVPRTANFRSKFVAPAGWKLIVADFSQIELRVAAELSGEPRMIEAYKAGRDLHTETASLMARIPLEEVTKTQRTAAKISNFGLLYGAGPATLRKQSVAQYGIDINIKEAKGLVNQFREAYPDLYKWQVEQGEGTTTAVFTRYGRRRILVGFNDKFTTRINTQVQGTAGDIAKIAIAKLWESLHSCQDEAHLIAMVHDEIVLEAREDVVPKWSALLKQAMEDAGAVVCRTVPIVAEVDHGETWADAK